MRPRRREVKVLTGAIWATVALSIIWGYNWIVMKECLLFCPPFEFAALRTMIGALSLFAFLAFRGQSLKPKALFLTLVLGLLGTTICIGLVTWGLYLGGVGKTATLVYIMPFWVLILARPILGERIHGLQWTAVPLAFAGLIIILEPWDFQGTATAGILAILAGLAWALSAIVTKIIRRRVAFDLISLTAWQMFLGALPLVLLWPFIPSQGIKWTPYFVGGLLYSSVISQAVALVLWFYILQELPAGTASLGTLATPVIGTIAAAVQLGERPSTVELVGMVLILLGLSLLTVQGLWQARQLSALLKEDR